MTASMLAIVNPAAGGGRCGRRAPAALDELRAQGLNIDVCYTQTAGDASRIAAEAYASGQRDFLAVGGDGTVHEVVNGLMPVVIGHDRARLGFLPLGTGNSFLRDFSRDGATHARNALVQGACRGTDVIRIRHSGGTLYSLNIISIGFVADVCTTANRVFKPLGPAGYALGVVAELATLRPRAFPFRLDDGQRWDAPAAFVSFNNSKFTGGSMMMAPAADVLDGKLEVVFVSALPRLDLLRTFPKIFNGAHVKHPAVRCAQATHVEFDLAEPVDVMVDGEVVTLTLKSLEVLPNALDVRA